MSTDNNNSTSVVNPSESFSTKTYTLTGAAVFALLGIPANILNMVLILRERKPSSTTTYFLLNLALSDIANLMSVLLVAILLKTTRSLSNVRLSDSLKTIAIPPKAIANITLALIALERYSGLVKTMKPFFNISKKKVKRLIVAVWLVSIGIQTPGFIYRMCNTGGSKTFLDPNNITCIIIAYFLPLSVVGFCYGKILKGVTYSGTILGRNTTDETALRERQAFIRVMILIAVVFMLFNLPAVVLKILKTVGYVTDYDLFCVVLLLGCVSSTINPYLYGLQRRIRRQQIRRLLYRPKHSSWDLEQAKTTPLARITTFK